MHEIDQDLINQGKIAGIEWKTEFEDGMSAWNHIASELYDCLYKIRTADRAITSGNKQLQDIGASQLRLQMERADRLLEKYGGVK
jgi:hypothetical protein